MNSFLLAEERYSEFPSEEWAVFVGGGREDGRGRVQSFGFPAGGGGGGGEKGG